ncbi:MAG TPA: hypothetical protein VLV83_20155 [Acidobacteriota bacterium]|nr:hypothetical protein [Acidobacteriota bacterium]
MLERLFHWLNVDYRQWKALTAAALKLDIRSSAGVVGKTTSSNASGLVTTLFFYAFSGIFIGLGAWINKDVLFSGLLFLGFLSVMIAATILIEFHSIVISPQDFAVLAYRPVSDATFFLARLTNVLLYTLAMTTALALVPSLAYSLTLGWNPLMGLASLTAAYLTAMLVTLVMVLLYAAILRFVRPSKLRRVLSYFQMLMSFLVYGGYILVPRFFPVQDFAQASIPRQGWIYLLPWTWYAGLLEIASGTGGWMSYLALLAGLAIIAGLLTLASRRMSLDFSRHLNQLEDSAPKAAAGPRTDRGWLWNNRLFAWGEGRAVALLISSQFRHDQRFRLSVLSIIPLTLLYLFMGISEGTFNDPFDTRQVDYGSDGLLYIAVMLFPLMLASSLANSDSYQASWIYYASPADKAGLVKGMKNFVMFYFLGPYLLLLAAIFAYFLRDPLHVAVHIAVLAMCSHLSFLLALMADPVLPFSRPVRKGSRTSRMLVPFLVLPIATMLLLPTLFRIAYGSLFSMTAALAGLLLGNGLLSLWADRRIRAKSRKLIFSG